MQSTGCLHVYQVRDKGMSTQGVTWVTPKCIMCSDSWRSEGRKERRSYRTEEVIFQQLLLVQYVKPFFLSCYKSCVCGFTFRAVHGVTSWGSCINCLRASTQASAVYPACGPAAQPNLLCPPARSQHHLHCSAPGCLSIHALSRLLPKALNTSPATCSPATHTGRQRAEGNHWRESHCYVFDIFQMFKKSQKGKYRKYALFF